MMNNKSLFFLGVFSFLIFNCLASYSTFSNLIDVLVLLLHLTLFIMALATLMLNFSWYLPLEPSSRLSPGRSTRPGQETV